MRGVRGWAVGAERSLQLRLETNKQASKERWRYQGGGSESSHKGSLMQASKERWRDEKEAERVCNED